MYLYRVSVSAPAPTLTFSVLSLNILFKISTLWHQMDNVTITFMSITTWGITFNAAARNFGTALSAYFL